MLYQKSIEPISLVMANLIYGPSYVSMDSALSYYGLIPEGVTTTTSITTKRAKRFSNSFGVYNYIYAPNEYYSIGITSDMVDNRYSFLIAKPEKALCDKIIFTKKLNIKSFKTMETLLFDDLRVDLSGLKSINLSLIENCIEKGYKKLELKLLMQLLQKYY
jgi:hypothetical protein